MVKEMLDVRGQVSEGGYRVWLVKRRESNSSLSHTFNGLGVVRSAGIVSIHSLPVEEFMQ